MVGRVVKAAVLNLNSFGFEYVGLITCLGARQDHSVGIETTTKAAHSRNIPFPLVSQDKTRHSLEQHKGPRFAGHSWLFATDIDCRQNASVDHPWKHLLAGRSSIS
jgi:hypothetical protein